MNSFFWYFLNDLQFSWFLNLMIMNDRSFKYSIMLLYTWILTPLNTKKKIVLYFYNLVNIENCVLNIHIIFDNSFKTFAPRDAKDSVTKNNIMPCRRMLK